MYEAVKLLNKQDLDGNGTKENIVFLWARAINLLMQWWRKREWDWLNLCIAEEKGGQSKFFFFMFMNNQQE